MTVVLLAPLATKVDVVAALGRDLTEAEDARVESILAKVSELFRLHSGQIFTPGTSHVELKVNGGKVYLPQRPVVEVTEVTDGDGGALGYSLFGQWLKVGKVSHEFIRVKYSHGDAVVPDLVRLTVADVARKVLLIAPDAATGVSQVTDTAGPFSRNQSYATWAQGGQTMLAPDDKAIARSFRAKVPTVWVMVP